MGAGDTQPWDRRDPDIPFVIRRVLPGLFACAPRSQEAGKKALRRLGKGVNVRYIDYGRSTPHGSI